VETQFYNFQPHTLTLYLKLPTPKIFTSTCFLINSSAGCFTKDIKPGFLKKSGYHQILLPSIVQRVSSHQLKQWPSKLCFLIKFLLQPQNTH